LGRVGEMGGCAIRHPRIHLTAFATSAFAACAVSRKPEENLGPLLTLRGMP